jgi:hypothetical protein
MALAVVLMALGACGDDTASDATATTSTLTSTTEQPSGSPAVWVPDPARPVDSGNTTIAALVTRLGCNGGITGTVYPPAVEITATEAIVTFTVEPNPGAHTCPSNDQVPFEVDLGQPLGDRALVDGSCRTPDGAALRTSFCDPDEASG